MKSVILITAVACALAACGNDPQPVYQTSAAAPVYQQAAQAPVVVQAAPQRSGMQDMLTGAAIGALATHALSGGGRSAAPAPTVINNTHTRVVERTVIVRQAAAPAKPEAPRPAAAVPSAPSRPAATAYTPPRTSYAPPARVVPSYSSMTIRRK